MSDYTNFVNMLKGWKDSPESKNWTNKEYTLSHDDNFIIVEVDNTCWKFDRDTGKLCGFGNYKE